MAAEVFYDAASCSCGTYRISHPAGERARVKKNTAAETERRDGVIAGEPVYGSAGDTEHLSNIADDQRMVAVFK